MSKIPKGLCQCGCGGRTTITHQKDSKRGYERGEPQRFIEYHHLYSKRPAYKVNLSTGCWEWQRYKAPTGYGTITVKNRVLYTHRHYYEKFVGPIPDGFVIDHLCRNRSCVNPKHLEAVTQAENVRRSDVAKLRKADVIEIRNSRKSGIGSRQLAERFGVTRDHLTGIIANDCWNSDI